MKNLVLRILLFVVSVTLAPLIGHGQGWERVYDSGGRDFGVDVLETQDDNFVVLSWKDPNQAGGAAVLSKIDHQGQLLWQKGLPITNAAPLRLHERPDGILIIMCEARDAQNQPITELHFFSAAGAFLQTKKVNITALFPARPLDSELKGDTLILVGYASFPGAGNVTFLTKADLDGNVLLTEVHSYIADATFEEFSKVQHDAAGNFWVIHRYISALGEQRRQLLKLDNAGVLIKTVPLRDNPNIGKYPMVVLDSSVVVAVEINNYPVSVFCFVQQFSLSGDSMKLMEIPLPSVLDYPELRKTQNGGVALLTQQYPLWPNKSRIDIGFLSFDKALNPLWNKTIFRNQENQPRAAVPSSEGGMLIVGFTSKTGAGDEDLYLIRTDSFGNSITNLIQGNVQWDKDKDCIEQPMDPGLSNWILTATSLSDTIYRSTATDGAYVLRVDTGHYTVRVRPLNSLWDADCVVLDTVLTQFFDTIQQNFPIRAAVDCPGMELSTGVARLRPCFPAQLQVWYCNNGTVDAENAGIQVVLNEHMTYDSASLIPTLVSGDTLWFDLDTVAPFECGNFYIQVIVDCDTTLLGQTLCYTAHAFPDTTCLQLPEWLGAQVVATGACTGDSVRLVLRNVGTAPTSPGLEYIIVEDNVILMQAPFGLPAGDSIVLMLAANGSTWRIIATQEPGFPGAFLATVALEGCHAGGNFSIGYVNQFPNGDGAPWFDEECRTVTGSYDPNDKSAVPEGYTAQHFLMANTDIEYMIRFQNTGTDTAFRVMIRDQISANLDPASIRPGAASHPYTWSLDGNGELSFLFDPIQLPDSSTNLAASQGFVQFRVSQKPNLAQGTRFENQAAIYFDFNAPIITNTVFHTVNPLFMQSSSVRPPVFAPDERFKIWPNPADEQAYITFHNGVSASRQLSLYDLKGQLIAVTFSQQNTVTVQRGNLPSGVYLLSIAAKGEKTQLGLVVFR